MKQNKAWTTHMPMLIKFIQATKGPVAELGAGPGSTPLLHWLCVDGRKLVSYEDSQKYANYAKSFESENHKVVHVNSYDEVDTKIKWSVVLIDHRADRRVIDAIRLKDSAEYIVIHDTQHRRLHYKYHKMWPHFKYVYHWMDDKPHTSVVSNFHKL